MAFDSEYALLFFAVYLLVFAFGSCIGSFVNVLAYRIPAKLSFVKGRSACTSCGHSLGAADLVPLFSFLFLKRRCRYCGERISSRYFWVELAGGLLALLTFAVYGLSLHTLCVAAVMFGLLTVSLIDIDTLEIPNGLIIFLLIPAVCLTFLKDGTSVLDHIIGAVCVSVPLLLLALIIPGSFGGGDIKLMAVCGLAMGWKLTLFSLFVALLLGGGYAIYLLSAKKGTGKKQFAFGPSLSAGIAAAFLAGDAVIGWYIGLLG